MPNSSVAVETCNLYTLSIVSTPVKTQEPGFFRRFGPLEVMFVVYLIAGVIVTIIEYNKGIKPLYGDNYFHFNNFIIFKQAWFNLLSRHDLYIPHPNLYFDLYKYSPSFPLLMIPMAYLPNFAGLMIWNLAFNTLSVFLAVVLIPHFTDKQKALILILLVVDIMTSLHNAQSNGLMTALFIAAFSFLERRRMIWGVLCIMLMAYTKLFGLAALLLLLVYPEKKRSIPSVGLWLLILTLLPVVFVDLNYLVEQYRQWLTLLTTDHARSLGISLLGLINAWFSVDLPKITSVIIGAVLLILPLMRRSKYDDPSFRLMLLSSTMIWVVIFNHKAESSTFVIAMAGVLIWYFAGPRSVLHHLLLAGAVLLVSFSPTDLFPASWRGEVIAPLRLKALPPIVIWGALTYEILTDRRILVGKRAPNPTSAEM